MQQLPISHVFRREDGRKVDPAAIRGLVESIREVGIINPLRVRPVRRHVDGVPADAWEVTAGGHRLAAALKLGLETVPCIVVEEDDLHAELAMIDENLQRTDLSPADRAKQTARRKEIYKTLNPGARHGGDRKSDQVANSATRSFDAVTAEAVGSSERAVRLDAERGEKVAVDVLEKVRGTRLDTGTYLDTLKKLPEDEQRARVEKALAAPKQAKRAPAPMDDAETEEQWLAAIMRLWNRGSREWRERFLAEVDTQTMDRRFGS